MKMEPDLLLTLSDPGTKPDREASTLLALGQLLAKENGKRRLPTPDLVLLAREAAVGGVGVGGSPSLIFPGAGEAHSPSALEQLLAGVDPASLRYLCREETRLVDQLAGVGDEGDPDCPGEEGLALRLLPAAQDAAAAGRGLVACSPALQPEAPREGGPFPASQPEAERGSGCCTFAMDEASPEGRAPPALGGLLLRPLWTTTEVEGREEPLALPESPLWGPLVLPGASQAEVDLFSSFPSCSNHHHHHHHVSPSPELGQAGVTVEEPSGGLEDASRLRAVFDALDRDGDGVVRIEDFVQFATVYGAEQVIIMWTFVALENQPQILLKIIGSFSWVVNDLLRGDLSKFS